MTQQEKIEVTKRLKFFGENFSKYVWNNLGKDYYTKVTTVNENHITETLYKKPVPVLMAGPVDNSNAPVVYDLVACFSECEKMFGSDIQAYAKVLAERISVHYAYVLETYE